MGPSGRRGRAPRRRAAAAVFLALLALAPLARRGPQLVRQKGQFAGNRQDINEVQVELGRWVKSAGPPDEAAVVIDAGAIRYFGERWTIDLFGLNDHELAFDQPLRERLWRDAEALAGFMDRRRAGRLVLFPAIFPQLVCSPPFLPRFRAETARSACRATSDTPTSARCGGPRRPDFSPCWRLRAP